MSDNQSLTKYEDSTSLVAQAAQGASKQLEYLRGHEKDVGKLAKLLVGGSALIWFAFNYKAVGEFVAGIVDIETKLIYGGILAVVLWGMWELLSSKTLQFMAAKAIDQGIERFFLWRVRNDPEGYARFAINKSKKKLAWGEENKAKIRAAYTATNTAAEGARVAALKARDDVKGFMQEKADRVQGHGNPRIRLSDGQLENSLALAKSNLRREYQFYQEETAIARTLESRYGVIRDVLDWSQTEITSMELDLADQKRRFELEFAQMSAVEAANAVQDGTERKTFNTAMGNIAQRADEFAGRTRMILDRLDSTIQAYHANQASAVIADDQFFQNMVNDPDLQIKPDTQQKLLVAGEKPVIEDMEILLSGSIPQQREKVLAQTGRKDQSSTKISKFDDLLR